MVTLIAVYTSDGCIGRCDENCYTATQPDCTCICGGKNHGVGLRNALDQTREQAQQWLGTYYERQHLAPGTVRAEVNNTAVNQLELGF